MIAPEIKSESEYRELRAICDAAAAYAESVMCEGTDKRRRNYLTADEAAAPVYAACSHEMRGKVEQWELLADTPERLSAYIGSDDTSRPLVTVWTGLPIGRATCLGRVSGRFQHTRVFAYRARINGREFYGRGQGEGMFINLRETAESKRNRESI
jgi:hypothetical protein